MSWWLRVTGSAAAAAGLTGLVLLTVHPDPELAGAGTLLSNGRVARGKVARRGRDCA